MKDVQTKFVETPPEVKATLRKVPSLETELKERTLKRTEIIVGETEIDVKIEEKKKAKGERKERNNGFLKKDWTMKEDKKFYYFTQKYYRGPKFKEQIKLTKDKFIVTENEESFVVGVVKK